MMRIIHYQYFAKRFRSSIFPAPPAREDAVAF